MKIFLVIHGTVQGVGYRHLVSRAAKRNQIRGMVRNMDDGSVHVLADGEPERLSEFEKAINVSMSNGPQVFNIERYEEGNEGFPKNHKEYGSFVVER